MNRVLHKVGRRQRQMYIGDSVRVGVCVSLCVRVCGWVMGVCVPYRSSDSPKSRSGILGSVLKSESVLKEASEISRRA